MLHGALPMHGEVPAGDLFAMRRRSEHLWWSGWVAVAGREIQGERREGEEEEGRRGCGDAWRHTY